MSDHDCAPDDAPLSAQALGKLKWRCRRGLLENDLFITRFFERHEAGLTHAQARALETLMDLSDHDLLELLLQRRQPDAAWADAHVLALLQTMHADGAHRLATPSPSSSPTH
ncbi:succinate dehydrogenase assembly factor 2 [Xenophilus arseniciresistens]|uniref:FAD assembly factor SdhE n=1 Tax=Xenophilus arseniciresistens TaxID=1283306 RepID=A0AAE3N7D9_9BURK|nr:succinate dehydrogenase assembly factor 2 [Xenophilus arseniciresistens]MDA7416506.1 succinate dehydrogenase assembly factor 2 [Xenophilus arseniciresistens]